MTGRRQIIDAHHHLWDLTQVRYPWLAANGVKRFFGDPTPIQQNYLTTDFREDAIDYELKNSVHIQVGATPDDALKETQWLQQQAEDTGLPSAIVAFADLTENDLSATMEQHQRFEHFRGVRQIIGRHPQEDKQHGTDDLLETPNFLRGLKLLEKAGLSFDLQLTESQYHRTSQLLQSVPELNVAICHFASPWDLSPDGFMRWRDSMKRFSTLPNIHFKFSGFGMFKPDWRTDDIKPFVEEALTTFGVERCMAGSNFPVDKLYGGYNRIWESLFELTPDEAAYKKITYANAARFYQIAVT